MARNDDQNKKSRKLLYLWLFRKFRDELVGFLYSFYIAHISFAFIKNAIGRPRPNHYSLFYYGEYSNIEMGKVKDYNDEKNPFIHNSFLSCPSGHAGFSMATFLYLSLLLYEDAFLLFSICNSDVGEQLQLISLSISFISKSE